MEAAQAAHRAALAARKGEMATDRPTGVGIMHRSKSPAGRSAAVPKSPRPGLQQRDRSGGGSGGGARGRTEARKDAADASPWDAGYVYRPTVPMHLRGWSPRAASPPAAATPVLRIVSYNILAETLESNTTAGLDPQIASFRARKALLAHELESWNADIYCFQEVTPSTPITPPSAVCQPPPPLFLPPARSSALPPSLACSLCPSLAP